MARQSLQITNRYRKLSGGVKRKAQKLHLNLQNRPFEQSPSTLRINFKNHKLQPQSSGNTDIRRYLFCRRRFKHITPQIFRAISFYSPRVHHRHHHFHSPPSRPSTAAATASATTTRNPPVPLYKPFFILATSNSSSQRSFGPQNRCVTRHLRYLS